MDFRLVATEDAIAPERQRRVRKGDPTLPSEPCPARICAACRAIGSAEPEALAPFAAKVRGKTLRAGEPVYRARDDRNGLTVVAEGMVMVQQILADGRRQVIGLRYPGDLVSFADGVNARLQPLAVLPSVLCRVDGRTLDDFRRRHPKAAERLSRLAAEEVARMADQMMLLGRLTAAERMAVFLLECAGRLGRRDTDGIVFSLPMTRDDIADYLGINVETMSRQFTRMKRRDVIALPEPDRAVIRDWAALRALAPFMPVAPVPARVGLAEINPPAAA